MSGLDIQIALRIVVKKSSANIRLKYPLLKYIYTVNI